MISSFNNAPAPGVYPNRTSRIRCGGATRAPLDFNLSAIRIFHVEYLTGF
jgi:hypothetical protein